jgi:hypothetical protein
MLKTKNGVYGGSPAVYGNSDIARLTFSRYMWSPDFKKNEDDTIDFIYLNEVFRLCHHVHDCGSIEFRFERVNSRIYSPERVVKLADNSGVFVDVNDGMFHSVIEDVRVNDDYEVLSKSDPGLEIEFVSV